MRHPALHTLALTLAVALLGAGVAAVAQAPDGTSVPPAQPSAGLAGSTNATLEAPPTLTVGDPFWYVVTLTMPQDSVPSLPGNEAELPPFEIRDFTSEEIPSAGDMKQITLRYQLVGFQVGEFEIAGLEIEAKRTVDGKPHVDKYLAPPVKVAISSVLPGPDAQVKPIFGPLMIRPWWHSWVFAAFIALLLLAVLGVLVWLWLRRRRSAGETAVRELTPHERALAALTALRDGKLIAAGRFKDFYSEMGDTLRRWLEHRAHIEAMEATTALIRHDLRRSDLPDDWQRELITLLARGDLVKFAKWVPEDSVAYTDLDAAFDLLQRGKAPEAQAEQEAVA